MKKFVMAMMATASIGLVAVAVPPGSGASQIPGTNGRIAYTVFDTQASTREVVVVDADGSNETVVLPAMTSGPAVFSPDNTRITRSSSTLTEIYVSDPDLSNQITVATSSDSIGWMVWSPDGTGVYFMERIGGGASHVKYVPADGSAAPTTIFTESVDSLLAFNISPDGTTIALIIRTGAAATIQLHAISGGSTSTIASYPTREAGSISFSPDGTRLLMAMANASFSAPWTLTSIGIDGTGEVDLYSSSTDSAFGSWSPDGTKLVLTTRTGTTPNGNRLWVADADGSNATSILGPLPDGNLIASPAWLLGDMVPPTTSTTTTTSGGSPVTPAYTG